MTESVQLGEHPLARQFFKLTPEHVLDAVEAGGRRTTGRFIILNSYENRVYQLELDDDSMVVGKFYRPGRWSREQIREEHVFLSELIEEEIPVAGAIDLGEGDTIGEVQSIFYALYPRVGGRAPQELSDEQVQMLGRLIARIHNVGARGDAPNRPRLTPEYYGRKNLEFLMEREMLPIEARDVYRASVEALIDRIEPFFRAVPMHRIHGDCHLGNLIWTPAGPTFLDFDDMLIGPAVQDIWMMVPSYDSYGQRQRELLIEAYATFRDFDPAWLKLIEPLRALRYVHYATWIARRWEDPVFRRTWPQFGDIVYWQREVQDLREQIARIDQSLY